MTASSISEFLKILTALVSIETGIILALVGKALTRLNKRVILGLQIFIGLVLAGIVFFGIPDSIIFVLIVLGITAAYVTINLFYSHFYERQEHSSAAEYAETYTASKNNLDIQLNILLTKILKNEPLATTEEFLQRCFDYSISILEQVMGIIPKKDDAHICLLKADEDGAFAITASSGIKPNRIQKIQKEFRWKEPVKGLAGLAASRGKTIIVRDFDSPESGLFKEYWAALDSRDKMEGTIICFPIMRGVAEQEPGRPLAVLCITSRRKKAWTDETINDGIGYIAQEIEAFFYIRELALRLSKGKYRRQKGLKYFRSESKIQEEIN